MSTISSKRESGIIMCVTLHSLSSLDDLCCHVLLISSLLLICFLLIVFILPIYVFPVNRNILTFKRCIARKAELLSTEKRFLFVNYSDETDIILAYNSCIVSSREMCNMHKDY